MAYLNKRHLNKFVIISFLSLSHFSFSQIGIKDIWQNYRFYATKNEAKWLSDTSFITIGDNISITHFLENTEIKNIPFTRFSDSLKISNYFTAPTDTSIIGFMSEGEALYRYSEKAYVFVYDLASDSIITQTNRKVYNPSFSYDLHYLAYTDRNNLFILDLHTNTETQLTDDGEWNSIINGRTDWVYEEEFGFTKAYHWIPNSHKIAYLKFDESEVKTYDIQLWGKSMYPEFYSYKYPKAGEENSIVTVNVFDIETSEDLQLFETDEEFEYVPKLGVTNEIEKFYFFRTNRLQNKLEMLVFDTDARSQESVYYEESDKYVEVPETIEFVTKGFILDSYQSGYKHFHLVQNDTIIDLTPGDYDVKDFLFYKEQKKELYFTALFNNTHTQSICKANEKKVKSISKKDYWTEAIPSPNEKHLLLTQSNLETPYINSIVKTKKLKQVALLDTNEHVHQFLTTQKLGKVSFFDVKAPEGHAISCLKILPPDFDSTKTYPLLMHCYGGPGHQVVTNEWNPFDHFYHQLLAQKGCIVVLADGRGTDGKGLTNRQASYGQFGKFEHEDQVTVAKYFKSKSYVDANRIGIWGWSYGGYLSSLCILKSPDVFTSAIAVAPVTNWRYYDNIYTERYMGLPQQNAFGYDENSPTSYAKNLKGNFFLIHGTSDDNVHIQNSYALQNELLKYNKEFDTFYYPNKNHGIYGGTTRYNLYLKMYNFMKINLLDNDN